MAKRAYIGIDLGTTRTVVAACDQCDLAAAQGVIRQADRPGRADAAKLKP